MKTNITSLEKTVGIFALVTIVLLVAFLVLQIKEGRIFERTFIINTVIDKGYGLSKGSKVFLNGIAAGVVEEVSVTDNNMIKLSMSILKPFQNKIRKGSVAVVVEPLALGSTEINITPGPPENNPLKNGDTIPATIPDKAFAKFENIPDAVNTLLDKVNTVLDETTGLLENVNTIAESINKREGSLGEILNDDKKLYNSVDELLDLTKLTIGSSQEILKKVDATVAEVAEASKSIPEITLMVKEEIQNLSASQQNVENLTTNLNDIAENLKLITDKIVKGEGTLGKFINDPSLFDKAKEAVDSTTTIVESIKQTKTFVGVDTDYYSTRKTLITRFHLKVVPRDSRYFLLGGALYSGGDEDETITASAKEDSMLSFEPEFIIAQKIFDNKLTLRGGLLEGKLGGGVDYAPWGDTNYQFTMEGRDTFDDLDFNEGLDNFLLRFKVNKPFATYFHVEAGVDDILNDPGLFLGIGFEYLDEDITKVVGLISAGT
ncbi:MAG: MCE family protein [Planctomycetes bacterium]|nr:MCE family protein [Planctomycetota bacterium]